MIVKLKDGTSFQFLKKDLKLLKVTLSSLRRFILSLLRNGYKGVGSFDSICFENGEQGVKEIKIEDVVFSCLPSNLKLHLSGLKVYSFPSISCSFKFKEISGISLKHKDIISLEINKILNEENLKLISKISKSVEAGNRLIREVKLSELNLRKRFYKFQND